MILVYLETALPVSEAVHNFVKLREGNIRTNDKWQKKQSSWELNLRQCGNSLRAPSQKFSTVVCHVLHSIIFVLEEWLIDGKHDASTFSEFRSGTLCTAKPDVSIGRLDRNCNTELVDAWACPIRWGKCFFMFILKSVLHSPYVPRTGVVWRCEETLEEGRWWKFSWILRNTEQAQRGEVQWGSLNT